MMTPESPGTTTPGADSAPASALVACPADADRGVIVHQLHDDGYHVDTASSTDEAFAKLRADEYDVVLLDVHLPGLGGPRFLEALRHDDELAQVPVIAVAAADDVESIAACFEHGAHDHLPRPFLPPMLRARLRAALDRQRLLDAETLEREMEVARNIQRDFLPEALPLAMGLQLQAVLQPARQVSGDFYDAFTLAPSGTIVMVVGDVCDKGVGAALFMALFRSLIRASADPVAGGAIQMIGGRRTLVRQALESATPADLLTRVAGFTNDYIARLHGRTNMFATVFLAAIDPMTGHYDYVNCGHEPAIVLTPEGTMEQLRRTGPTLGLDADQVFEAGQGSLGRGHCLLAFTDGLVEARRPGGEAFGAARLRETLQRHTTVPAKLVQGVMDAVNAFTGNAEPHDDVTLLAATRTIG